MSKKIFEEKQRFNSVDIIVLLSFFIIGLTIKFVNDHLFSSVDNGLPVLTYVVFIVPLIACVIFLFRLKLEIKATCKSVRVKFSSFSRSKYKIRWEDVEECEIINQSGAAKWCGWNINYEPEKLLSLIGRAGLHIRTKQGENFVIGTKNPFALKQVILQAEH